MSLIIPANTLASGGYEVDNSLRFNSASDDYLKRTPSSSGNRKTWTWSSWVKKAARGSDNYEYIFNCTDASTTTGRITSVENAVDVFDFTDDLISLQLRPNALNRDFSAWYNLVVALDTTQGTAANRVKMYVNGEQITSFATANYPNQNVDGTINLVSGSYAHHIGSYVGTNNFFNGYMAEVCFIDGTALGADSFGEFDEDSGIWKPIDVSGLTFGTNGFYLEFKESGTGTNASGMGADTSGNTNHFAVNNLTAVDKSTDTCTNNFATFNPLDKLTTGAPTGSEGNLKLTGNTSSNNTWNSTIGLSAGKWYVEMKVLQSTPDTSIVFRAQTNTSGSHNNSYGFDANGSRKLINGLQSGSAIGSTSQNDILGMALDLDNGKMFIHRNGTYLSSGDPANGTNPFIVTADGMPTEGVIGGHVYNGAVEWNFGSPSFAISSGNQDGNGYGNFEYAVPSGYYSLNTKNLSEYG